jgi:hypothetical protein
MDSFGSCVGSPGWSDISSTDHFYTMERAGAEHWIKTPAI